MTAFAQRQRPMAVVIGLLIVLEAAANPVLAAAFGFDLQGAAHFGSLFDRGPESAELLRWGALLDLGGYLAFGVVVIYVGQHLRAGRELVVGALTASGGGAVLVGATGAALLATVGPGLLMDFQAASAASREDAVMALETLGRVVSAGLWGNMVFGLLGVWLTGIGWLIRHDARFAIPALIAGIAMLVSSLRTGLTGRILPDVAGPLDTLLVVAIVAALSFLFVWLLWLAVRLWQGPRVTQVTVIEAR